MMDVDSNNLEEFDYKKIASEEIFSKYKTLQRQLELLTIQEDYIKEEIKNLRVQFVRSKEEIKVIQSTPLIIGQFNEMVDENYALVTCSTGATYCVRVLSTLNREDLKTGASIALHKSSQAVVDILAPEADSNIQMSKITDKPDVSYHDIGGLDVQKQEIKEAVELPLTNPELYLQIGIDPPRGVLLYGPPGTGKTMLAKAVANNSTASFIRYN
jgi:26S proteasome regulatory subunit T3